MNAPAPKTSPDTALGNLMAAALDVPAAPEQPAVPDDTLARTGNTARDQEMYAAGIRTGEENAKHNAAIRAGASWQPIESAPKTGCTLLLGYWNSHGKWRTVRGQWISAEYIA
ncbi:hypothetical protein [Achromobacter xylosoxidans]|nr:hypothetical protein [Achromobacter xylosoxidans]